MPQARVGGTLDASSWAGTRPAGACGGGPNRGGTMFELSVLIVASVLLALGALMALLGVVVLELIEDR